MKKGIMAVAIAATLGVPVAGAFDLYVNGTLISGVSVEQFSASGSRLDMTTTGAELIASTTVDTDNDGIPDSEDDDDDNDGYLDVDDAYPKDPNHHHAPTGPDNDNDGIPDDEDDDDDNDGYLDVNDAFPFDPTRWEQPTAGSCTNSARISCGWDISASEWASTFRHSDTMTIPGGKVLVSSFTTENSSSVTGKISFTTPVIDPSVAINFWISATAGGPALSAKCSIENRAYTYLMRFTQFEYYKVCNLDPGGSYFMNMEHVDRNRGSSRIIREITN